MDEIRVGIFAPEEKPKKEKPKDEEEKPKKKK